MEARGSFVEKTKQNRTINVYHKIGQEQDLDENGEDKEESAVERVVRAEGGFWGGVGDRQAGPPCEWKDRAFWMQNFLEF